jgi:hypothetical protein
MRPMAMLKMGFYPLPLPEAVRIRRLMLFPQTSCAAIDPCVGDGVAFEAITSGAAGALECGSGAAALGWQQKAVADATALHGASGTVILKAVSAHPPILVAGPRLFGLVMERSNSFARIGGHSHALDPAERDRR